MFSDKQNLLELLVKHDTTTPLLLGVLNTAATSHTSHTSIPSPSQSPSQVHLHAHAQSHAHAHAHSQSPAHSLSPAQNLHSLHAIAQAHAQAQNLSQSQSHAYSQTQGSGADAGLIHVYRQLVRTLGKLLATACDSLAFMEVLVARVKLLFKIHKILFRILIFLQQVFMYILNVLNPSHALPTVLCLELSQLLVFSLKVSFIYLVKMHFY